MRNFEVRPLNGDEFPMWDNFVDESSQGTLFHKSYWLSASGFKPAIYGYFSGNTLLAGLPLVQHTEFTVRMATHPPLTPYLGLLFKEQNSKYVTRLSREKRLSREVARKLKEDFHYVNCNFPPGNIDLQPFIWENFTTNVSYTYIIQLDSSLDDIWKSMSDKNRNQIRKTEKDGITIIHSDEFEQTVNLVEKTFVRQGSKFLYSSTAHDYHKIMKEAGQCKSFLARDAEGELIATAYIIWDHKKSYYLLGGYDPYKSHGGASAAVLWEAIKYSKEQLGLREFDFEGSTLPEVEEFFREFGGTLVPCYHVTWASSRGKIYIRARNALSRLKIIQQLYGRVYLRR